MENKKIAKAEADIAKTRAKLAELQTQLKEQERHKQELENTNIVDMVRGLNISLADLPALLQSLSSCNTATSENMGPPQSRETLWGEEAQRIGADIGPNWPDVAERSLQRRGPKSEPKTKEETQDE